jgi:hypothetical protein
MGFVHDFLVDTSCQFFGPRRYYACLHAVAVAVASVLVPACCTADAYVRPLANQFVVTEE